MSDLTYAFVLVALVVACALGFIGGVWHERELERERRAERELERERRAVRESVERWR